MSVGAAEVVPGAGGGLEFLEAEPEIAARSPLALFWRRFRRDRVALTSLFFIVLLVMVAIVAPLVVKFFGLPGPYVQNLNLTDEFGSPLGTLIGLTFGTIAGYYRGWADTLLARLVDVVLSIPILLFGLGIGAACAVRGCLGGTVTPGVTTIIFLIMLINWTYIFRIVRGLVLSLREREFVEASRALGASDARIMFREILPNLIAPVIVYATLLIPLNILLEASLSFLGVGVKPPTASWGQMIAAATPIFNTAWWFMVFPGAALLLTVLAFNLLGDGLRDALSPRTAQ